MWPFNYKTHVDNWEKIKVQFEAKEPSVKLKLEPQDGIMQKIPAAAAAGNLPDVFQNMGKQAPPLIKQKVIKEIDTLYKDAKINPDEAFFPGAVIAFKYDGKMYGVPIEDNHVGWAIFVRMDAWKEVGLPFPQNREFKDWDEFYQMAQKLVKKDASGNVLRWGYHGVNGWSVSYVMQAILEQGANYWDDSKKTFTMSNEAGIKAITKIVWDPAHKYNVESDTLGTNSNENILKNKAATIQGTNQIIPLAKLDQPDLVIDGGLHPPMGPKYIAVSEGGWGFFLYSKAQKVDAAVKLLTYLNTFEPQAIWTEGVGAQPPGLKEVAKADFWNQPINAVGKKLLEVQDTGIYMTQGYEMGLVPELQRRWVTIATDLRAKRLTVEEAAKRADQEFNKQREDFLKQYG